MTEAGAPLAVLSVHGARKSWSDGGRLVDIVITRLDLHAGDFRTVTGPSGSGKSTALDMLALALRPDALDAMVLRRRSGGPDTDLKAEVLAGRGRALAALRAEAFAYVVQTAELMPFLTLAQNFDLQQRISGRRDPALWRDHAGRLDLSDVLKEHPGNLSVGQRQRAAVVRATASRPAILLADEPTSASDPDLRDRVIELLGTAASDGSAVLMVTHDLGLAEKHGLPSVPAAYERRENGWRTRFGDDLPATPRGAATSGTMRAAHAVPPAEAAPA